MPQKGLEKRGKFEEGKKDLPSNGIFSLLAVGEILPPFCVYARRVAAVTAKAG